MSDRSLNHSLYGEVTSRRHSEADALVRSRSHQRAAKSARSRRMRLGTDSTRRVRFMAVTAPTVVLVALAVAMGIVG